MDAYEVFRGSDLLGEIALERMMAKLSTRRYRAGLEPVGAQVETKASSTSKSSVSRRFVARTEVALPGLAEAIGEAESHVERTTAALSSLRYQSTRQARAPEPMLGSRWS